MDSKNNDKKKDNRDLIVDDFQSLEEVTIALRKHGVECADLIIGIDFSKSNDSTGENSYNMKSLHAIGEVLNPYQQVISILGKTLGFFTEDEHIACFGFGDALTPSHQAFSFYPGSRRCYTFEGVLTRYKEIVPVLTPGDPVSLAPVVGTASVIVQQTCTYTILLIIATSDQVNRSEENWCDSPMVKAFNEIYRARQYPLSIILVGVGDWPLNMEAKFHEGFCHHYPSNFHFVNYTEIMSKDISSSQKEIELAVSALKFIPRHFKETEMLRGSLGTEGLHLPTARPFDTPKFKELLRVHPKLANLYPKEDYMCPCCHVNERDMLFNCGHFTCCGCGSTLVLCPVCRFQIRSRQKVYDTGEKEPEVEND